MYAEEFLKLFEEISEDKYHKITEQLKSFEKQQEKLNEKRDKFIKSILK